MSNPNTRNFSGNLRADGFVLKQRRTFGLKVINKSGSAIAVNKPVAIVGYDVTSKLVKVVLADADASGHQDVWVTKVAISNNGTGHVFKGFMSTANLNTNSVATVGDPVYLDTTAGAFTFTAPSGGDDRVQILGYVQVKSSTVGQIAWDVQAPIKFGSGEIQSGVDASVLNASGTIASADITGASAGQLAHAQGVELVAAGGAHVINQLVYAIIILDYATAAYTGGGNCSINIGSGGAALTGVAAASIFLTASADSITEFVPLAATKNVYTENKGLNLVAASAPTQPGTAAGVLRYVVGYRQISTGL